MLSPQLHTQTHLGRVAVAEPWATTLLQLLTRSMFRKQGLSASQVCQHLLITVTEAIAHKRHVLLNFALCDTGIVWPSQFLQALIWCHILRSCCLICQ